MIWQPASPPLTSTHAEHAYTNCRVLGRVFLANDPRIGANLEIVAIQNAGVVMHSTGVDIQTIVTCSVNAPTRLLSRMCSGGKVLKLSIASLAGARQVYSRQLYRTDHHLHRYKTSADFISADLQDLL